MMKKIAIIGAGVAGLTALQTLADIAEITVFDKARGPGGRLSSKRVGEDSWDMGAQFIRAHSREFRHAVDQWVEDGCVARWHVTPWVVRGSMRGPSPDEAMRFAGAPRMTALSRHLLSRADHFIPSTRITCTEYSEERGWILTSEDGRVFGPFDGLVINTPPEQAVPLLPADTTMQRRISELKMRACWTMLLSFTEPVTQPFDAAFVRDYRIGWIARNSSKPDRDDTDTWVIEATHDWSDRNKDTPRDEVQRAMLHDFTQICGGQLPPIREQWLHRWLFAIPASSPGLGCLTSAPHNLVVTGDWCQHGSVEGAWISGSQAAQQLMEMLT